MVCLDGGALWRPGRKYSSKLRRAFGRDMITIMQMVQMDEYFLERDAGHGLIRPGHEVRNAWECVRNVCDMCVVWVVWVECGEGGSGS